MKLGAYTACLHDRSLAEVLGLLPGLGLSAIEVNSGGFIPAPHCPVDALLASSTARRDYLDQIAAAGLTLTALNCNGNPLNPLPGVGPKHADDLRRSIQLAGLLGVGHVVAMSGVPGSDPDARYPSWVVNPWDGVYLDVLDYQWEVATAFWSEIDALARDSGVRVALEMHPHNLAFNPPSLKHLVARTGATHLGAEMDPSHLMWQGMDVVEVIRDLGPLVFHAAAKDVEICPGGGPPRACSTLSSPESRPTPRARYPPATASGVRPGRPIRRGVSSRSVPGTTRTTGPRCCAPWPRSTPRWPSTSSTKTPR